MIVLDTNVLSELMRPAPSAIVESWLASQPMQRLFTTAVTQAEIFYGLALLPAGQRRAAMMAEAENMFAEDFEGRVLPLDPAAAHEYADIAATRRMAGRPIMPFDGQIAAIARSRNATVATRNVADFADCGLTLVDPWID